MPDANLPLDRRAWLRAALRARVAASLPVDLAVGSTVGPGLGLRAGLAALLGAPAGSRAQEGAAAPPLTLRTSTGEPVLGEGAPAWRALYLDFWASWCGPCKLSFPWMNELHQRHHAAGLRIVAVNLDARPQDAQDFLARLPARFALAFDPAGDSARVFGVKAMPSSFLIAPDRRLLLSHRGFRAEDRAGLERQIAAALA